MQRANRLLATLIITGLSLTGFSQNYDTGIGIRGGVAWGLTVKHFITTDAAGEILLTARHNGFNATGLFEKHIPVFDTEGFYFFYGAGVHFGLWNTDETKVFNSMKAYSGFDGIIGLEYSFEDLPLSIGLDWKPGFNLISDFGIFFDEIALSLRYIFN